MNSKKYTDINSKETFNVDVDSTIKKINLSKYSNTFYCGPSISKNDI